MINSVTYRIFFRSIMPLVLTGFLWTMAAPYFYTMMDYENIYIEMPDPMTNGAEEENLESMNDCIKDYKVRQNKLECRFLSSENNLYSATVEAFFDFHFLEILYPPPEHILVVQKAIKRSMYRRNLARFFSTITI